MQHFRKDCPSIEALKEELAKLLKKQEPNRSEIIPAVQKINYENWQSKAYVHFVNPENANQPNSLWQFKENIILESDIFGALVLDILTENRIGGIEFLARIK